MPNEEPEQVENYRLSEIFSIVPEFEGDQISLGTFLNACDCAYNMASNDQRYLLVIHIKNKMRGKAAQLINSRNPASYLEIKQLLSLHFGDSRDLSSLIQDLQRLKQLPNESPLTFYNRLQVLTAKMHASIQKTPLLNQDQKQAQTTLIDTMSLNTLLTGLEPRLGQIIRAGNPKDLLEAHVRIRRELQLSYFETQKLNKAPPQKQIPQQQIRRPLPSSPIRCLYCGRPGHTTNECRFRNPQHSSPHPGQFGHSSYQNQYNQSPNRPNFGNQQSPNASPFRPTNSPNQQKPSFNSQNQMRPPVIQRNPNYRPNHRTHHFNQNNPYDQVNYHDYSEYEDTAYEYPEVYPEYDNFNTDYHTDDNQPYDEFSEPSDPYQYQDFLSLPNQNHPPDSTDKLSEIETQIQALNLDDMNPNVNFPEQTFL